jgi:pimeloyl-ACP methyl ester carboxylesterase
LALGALSTTPGKIKVSTLVIFVEWDSIATEEGGKRLFDLLTGTQRKSRVIIGGGTHLLQLERVRFELYRDVRAFVEIGD